MDAANEVVKTYFQQPQQVQLENFVNASEVSAVHPLICEGYGIPNIKGCTEQGDTVTVLGKALQDSSCDEQREMLEMKNFPEDSGIFTIKTTHSEQVIVDKVMVCKNSGLISANCIIEEEIKNESDSTAIAEVPPARDNKFVPALADVNTPRVVSHQTDMIMEGTLLSICFSSS